MKDMIKPIAVYLTDTHLKENNHDLVFDIFKQCVSVCLKNKVKRIFHAGDFFTSRTSQTLSNLLKFCEILDYLNENNITLYGIPGNHDKTNQDSEKSYLDVFHKYDNFKIISNEKCFTFDSITIGFLPFFTESYISRLKSLEVSAKAKKTPKNLLITHTSFNGAINNDGSVVDEAISTKSVRFWDNVLVGHYHDSNSFKNINYTGSSYQANFGERIDDKGFHMIYSDSTTEFIPSNFPKFIKVKLDINDDVENEIELLTNNGQENNIRFIFQGDKTNLHKIDKQKLDDLGIDVKFEFTEVNEEILKVENGDFNSMSKKNILSYFNEYCKIQDIEKTKKSKGLKFLLK